MFTLNCKGRIIKIDKPLVMGIINITPDSFYEDSRLMRTDAILKKVEQMLNDGAAIIDIGGQSTRPGSDRISEEEELARVLPVIQSIVKHFPNSIISIDTFYSKVAIACVMAGASIVNDISAGTMDSKMISAVASLNVPYIIMHMKGEPKTMQDELSNENITTEVLDFFIHKVSECREAGINDLVIDPGIGFGKTVEQNFELIRNLSLFQLFECPLLLGVSRKSIICKTLNVSPDEALNGTSVLNAFGLMNAANILRVHDVKEAKETIKLYEACLK